MGERRLFKNLLQVHPAIGFEENKVFVPIYEQGETKHMGHDLFFIRGSNDISIHPIKDESDGNDSLRFIRNNTVIEDLPSNLMTDIVLGSVHYDRIDFCMVVHNSFP